MENLPIIAIVQYYQEVTARETCISFWTAQKNLGNLQY